MNCLCEIFNEDNIWMLIIIALILYLICNSGCCSNNGCVVERNSCGCGC
ncbi:MAG: hypothetical protein IKT54_07040 [Clostridia bacterium]|nr:hypothetical protein [Clostridia bacterium]